MCRQKLEIRRHLSLNGKGYLKFIFLTTFLAIYVLSLGFSARLMAPQNLFILRGGGGGGCPCPRLAITPSNGRATVKKINIVYPCKQYEQSNNDNR